MINTSLQDGNGQSVIVHIHEDQLASIPGFVEGDQETTLLACLWSARQLLVKAKTVEDAEETRQHVKALENLSKEFKLSKEVQVDATELRIRAERRLGEILQKTKAQGERDAGAGGDRKSRLHQVTVKPQTLSDIGITKRDSFKFQTLATIDEPSFESAVTNLKEQARTGRQSALSTTRIIKLTREKGRGDKEPEFSPLTKPSDNWNFGSLKYGRIDESMDEDWGYIPGEIYANC